MDKLGINEFEFKQNSYTRNDRTYTVSDLVELSKKHEPFELPIAGIDIGLSPWGELTIKSMAYHINRMNKADLKYPIILDDTGYICDGWHRLLKSIVESKETIKAIRLPLMPEPV
jgi:disulfide oxidoreductase YuzD